MTHLSADVLQDRLRQYFQSCLNRSLEHAYLLPTDPKIDIDFEVASLREWAAKWKAQLKQQSFGEMVRLEARELLAQDKPDPEQLQTACNGVLRADIENARILAAMLSGEYESTAPRDPLFLGMKPTGLRPLPGDAAPEPVKVHTLASLSDQFYAAKVTHDWVPKTAVDVKRVLELAKAVIGPKEIKSVSIEDVRAVRDALAKLPPNFTKLTANKGVTILEAIAANSSGTTLSLKTQDKYLTMFKQLLIWAANEGYIDKAPGANVKVAGVGKTNPAEQRNPYSREELKAIFTSPIFTGHQPGRWHLPGTTIDRDGKFWVPLIALYSGMRLGEIVQLLASDLKEEQGILFFDVTKGEDKKLKTASSKRRVPIHPILIQLGLLKVKEAAKAHARMFPEIQCGKDGYYSHNFSKWWGRYSKQIGFKASKTAFHSFRHNFTDALRAAEIPEYASKSLVGHVDKSVHAQYGSGAPLAVLKSSVDKVSYGVDVGWITL
jgi:integrase